MARVDDNGGKYPDEAYMTQVFLQEIRDNQEDQTSAIKANTKAVNELKAYLQQVFGGADDPA